MEFWATEYLQMKTAGMFQRPMQMARGLAQSPAVQRVTTPITNGLRQIPGVRRLLPGAPVPLDEAAKATMGANLSDMLAKGQFKSVKMDWGQPPTTPPNV